jgi:hypothetical protein
VEIFLQKKNGEFPKNFQPIAVEGHIPEGAMRRGQRVPKIKS